MPGVVVLWEPAVVIIGHDIQVVKMLDDFCHLIGAISLFRSGAHSSREQHVMAVQKGSQLFNQVGEVLLVGVWVGTLQKSRQ